MRRHPRMTDRIEVVGNRYATLPEVVLYSDVSDRAVRLYATLQRFVDLPKGAIPSRKTLAELLACSVDSLDRATKELVAHEFVTVEHRMTDDGKRHTSNRYHLVAEALAVRPPGDNSGGSRSGAATVGRTGAARGSRKAAALKNMREETSGAAQSELMERNRRRREGQPACEKCADAGVWIDDEGAHQCGCVA